jgi:3-oxoacyl-[acyl-carrier protein] reductase
MATYGRWLNFPESTLTSFQSVPATPRTRKPAEAAASVSRATNSSGEAVVGVMVEGAADYLGGLDIVVGNAGIWTDGAVENLTDADWGRMLAVNLSGPFHLCRAAIPHLRRSSFPSITLIASTAGQRGEARHSHYAASKGGVIALVRSLAVELAPIRVNAVSPGWIRTDMTEPFLRPETIGGSVRESIPLGQPGEPEDVAGPVLFLASGLARHMTGTVLNVNGGSVLA